MCSRDKAAWCTDPGSLQSTATIGGMSAPEAAPDDLRITATAEITLYLQQLQRDNARVQLTGPPGLSLTSRITTLSPDADLLGLEIATDPDGISQVLVAGGEITAVAYLGTIKLQFELDGAVLVSGDQGAVLRSTLPTRMYRFQRRQSFRVQPAGTLYPRVVLPTRPTEAGAAPDTPLPARSLRVLDISIGGIALALPPDFTPLAPGQVATGLVLELDRGTHLPVTLLPHHASALPGDPHGLLQLGCAFVDPSPADTRLLQVYVDQTQKRRRLLKLDS